jgi:hypothetical protein
VPDDSIIVTDQVASSIPGAGTRRYAATRDESGSYALIYAPVGRPFQVHMQKLSGTSVKATWFNPRDGSVQPIGEFSNVGKSTFTPPNPGELLDWVLVLDDASKNYPAPGAVLQ